MTILEWVLGHSPQRTASHSQTGETTEVGIDCGKGTGTTPAAGLYTDTHQSAGFGRGTRKNVLVRPPPERCPVVESVGPRCRTASRWPRPSRMSCGAKGLHARPCAADRLC